MLEDNNDWMFDKVEDLPAPSPRVMYKGPDAMRPGAGSGGNGEAFIFSRDGTLSWAPGVGHETMLDHKNPAKVRELLSHSFTPEEIQNIEAKTSYRGEPFFEDRVLRFMLIQRAVFGRVGRVSGYDMLSLWPGTDDLRRLLPMLVDKLHAENRIFGGTLITIGRDAMYTVDQFLQKKTEVTAKFQAASDSLAKLMQPEFIKKDDPENTPAASHGPSHEHPMSVAMKGAGVIGPGQKWWAPHSESVIYKFRDYVSYRDGQH
jgi:hypothetical protein